MNFSHFIHEHHLFFLHYALIIVFVGALLGGETIVILASIICHKNGVAISWVITAAIIGAIIANQTWLLLGKKYGCTLLKQHPHIDKATKRFQHWIKNKSSLMAVSSRFIYGAGSIIPLMLGINHYSGSRYLLYNIISAAFWGSILVQLSYILGNNAEHFLNNLKYIEYFFLTIIVLLVFHWIFKHRKLAHSAKKT